MHREGASDNSAPFLGTASCEKLCVSLQQPSEARPALAKTGGSDLQAAVRRWNAKNDKWEYGRI